MSRIVPAERRSRVAMVGSSPVRRVGNIVEQTRSARARLGQRLRFACAAGVTTSVMSACLDVSDVDEGSPTATAGTSGVADSSWDASGSVDAPAPKPWYLPDGRTYDHQLDYIEWSGAVSQVTITHKDETALPASEGGASCSNGCQEQVTRIEDGASVWGKFLGLSTFSLQVGLITDPGAGSVVLIACGQTAGTWKLGVASASVPGFVNLPSPAWVPPTLGECKWELRATGGYVLFRAVTVKKAA